LRYAFGFPTEEGEGMTPNAGIPKGWHSLTPYLTVNDATAALAFYKAAFGAEERSRSLGPDGKRIMHSELVIGDSVICVVDEFPEMGGKPGAKRLGGNPTTLQLWVNDARSAFERAVRAGARVTMPLADMFWGDRYGKVIDPFGNEWAIAQRLEELTPDQMRKRQEDFFKNSPR
jgi:PhnB protein